MFICFLTVRTLNFFFYLDSWYTSVLHVFVYNCGLQNGSHKIGKKIFYFQMLWMLIADYLNSLQQYCYQYVFFLLIASFVLHLLFPYKQSVLLVHVLQLLNVEDFFLLLVEELMHVLVEILYLWWESFHIDVFLECLLPFSVDQQYF